jgi:L-asparaginase
MIDTLHVTELTDPSTDTGVLVVLGTGGTIAGVSQAPGSRAYLAAQLPVSSLLQGLPGQAAQMARTGGSPWLIESEQVAQVDSKDMGWPVWRALLHSLQRHLARSEVKGIVITHGTDTLEESALLLHALLPGGQAALGQGKPVVLTAAMRPATAPDADGPQNLADALAVAAWAAKHGLSGVVAVMGGKVWAGQSVRKAHSWAMDAFDGGDTQAVATVQAGVVTSLQTHWPHALGWLMVDGDWPDALPDALPNVALVMAHADAGPGLLNLLLQDLTLRGLVLAGTGHGTLPSAWDDTLRLAHARGVVIWRSTRVGRGGVQESLASATSAWPATGGLTAAQARLALSLALWCCPHSARQPAELLCLSGSVS